MRTARRAAALALTSALVLTAALALAPVHAGLGSTASATASASASAATVQILVAAAPAELTLGATLTVNGTLGPPSEAPVALQADPYPFRGFTTVARSRSAADGSFSFAPMRPDRNTRLRVILEGPATPGAPTTPGALAAMSAVLAVTVDPRVAINARTLGPGQTRLSILIGHTVHGGSSAPVSASWFLAARGTRVFRLAAVTSTREIASGATYASATVDPPSKRFVYRVCLNPGWEAAMGRSAAHGRCPAQDYAVRRNVGRATAAIEYGGEGRGIPLAPYPSAGAIAAASSYLAGRAGRTSFAVVDSSGRLSGLRLREHFETASVVKVMMLVAFLQMRSAEHRGLSAADTSLLYPMIHISDNNAASAVFGIVGSAAVSRVARESGMSDYAPGVGWWAFTQSSAADQARFFFDLPRLIPTQFYAYARGLLAGIEPSQSWGVPPVARPRWQVFFKTGQLPDQGLFNEVARLERPGLSFTVAVFTDGDPSMSYGQQTIEGLAATLLAHAP